MDSLNPSPHTAPTSDEWLATWITFFGFLFIMFIFLAPWLCFTDEPTGWPWASWMGTPPSTVVRYVNVVPGPKGQLAPPTPGVPIVPIVEKRPVATATSAATFSTVEQAPAPDLSRLCTRV